MNSCIKIYREWYKKAVTLLSHVTLQLLHYYSVSQNYSPVPYPISLDDDINPVDKQDEKLVNLSFLSDGHNDWQLYFRDEDLSLSSGVNDDVISNKGFDQTVKSSLQDYNENEQNSLTESVAGSVLDSTGVSEGLLEDVEKDEQVKKVLNSYYPQLMSILKGKWDNVAIHQLEKEVQKFNIILQAAAGMLKVNMHSALYDKSVSTSASTLKNEFKDSSTKTEFMTLLPVSDVSTEASHMNHSTMDSNNICTSKESETVSLGDQHDSSQDLDLPADLTKVKISKDSNHPTVENLTQKIEEVNSANYELKAELHKLKGLFSGQKDYNDQLTKQNTNLEQEVQSLILELQVILFLTIFILVLFFLINLSLNFTIYIYSFGKIYWH